uniref:Uncharacterized protein n=1 Tax=Hanusia phi TaxID=3032 RepID=A0A7S0EHU6_9CRYP|mmetsp:Transcript_24862/g.56121  ORF Transcript_24862/g.56121 Transcript_24862/m.56121 type:complete len:525 (+) Transcript_24862:56-1630(+)
MFGYTPGKTNAQSQSGLFSGSAMSDLDVALEQKLLEIDNTRKGERFASGQPRHWDLVSEMRPQDSKIKLGRDSPTRSPPQKDLATFRRLLHSEKFANARAPEESREKRVTISYPEQDRDAQQAALALEKFLKSIKIQDVWIRGHSEAKLLDADPAFHNFQDLKHVQTCDLFVTIVNHAWQLDARCIQELELARKMHYTSLERNFTRPGQPRRPHIVALLLGISESQFPELTNMMLVGHSVLKHPAERISGLKSEDDESWSLSALETFRQLSAIMLQAGILSSSDHLSIEKKYFGDSAEKSEAVLLQEQAARAEKTLAEALQRVTLLSQTLAAVAESGVKPASASGAVPAGAQQRRGGIDPPGASSMPFASLMSPRYLGTLMHTMGGRMVWSLDITFDNLVDPLQVEATEGALVTGITGQVLYTLVNFFPNTNNPDESTAYWTRWCNVRIGHQAVETIKCNFDPVQGLILAEGVQVEQEHLFEDGEGALINPYQKYRMLLCSDGSLAATLYAGGEWDAVFRAHPF